MDLKSVRPNVISGGQLRKCGDLLEIEIYYNKRKFFPRFFKEKELSWDISLAEASSRSLSLQESSRGSFSWRSWISRFLELFSDCRSQSILGFLASLKSSSSRKISRSSLVHQQWSRCRSCNHFLLQPFLASSWLIFPCAQFFSLVHSSFGFTF